MAIHPYLAFAGNCREAFTRYQEVLGGELVLLTAADMPGGPTDAQPGLNPDSIIHAALTAGAGLLMGADDPSGGFDGRVRGMCVSLELPDEATASKVFDGLSEGGVVQEPMAQTFFSPAFGMCIDRFGIPWMVMAEVTQPTQPADEPAASH